MIELSFEVFENVEFGFIDILNGDLNQIQRVVSCLVHGTLFSGSEGGQLFDNNHYLITCQVGRKDVANNHWFDTSLPPIMCGIGSLRSGISV